MTTIYFVRHGQTISNVENKWAGQIEVPLTRLGILQAKKLQQECKHLHIDVIFSSPYKRAIDTCKNISKDHKLHIKTDDRLKERSFGYFEKKEVNPSSKNRICDWNSNSDLNANVETIQKMYYYRIKPFIKNVIKKYKNQTILIVAHSWVGRLLTFFFSNEKDLDCISKTPNNCELIKFVI